MPSTHQYAIGVDLSYTATGIAWPNSIDTFVTHQMNGDHIDRAKIIAGHVCAHARDAAMIVIEDGVNRSHAAFNSGILHGIVRRELNNVIGAQQRIVMVPPATLKKYATGKGNADKLAMVMAAYKRLGYDGSDHNEADALWLRAIGQELLDDPLCDMPVLQRSALDKLEVSL